MGKALMLVTEMRPLGCIFRCTSYVTPRRMKLAALFVGQPPVRHVHDGLCSFTTPKLLLVGFFSCLFSLGNIVWTWYI